MKKGILVYIDRGSKNKLWSLSLKRLMIESHLEFEKILS